MTGLRRFRCGHWITAPNGIKVTAWRSVYVNSGEAIFKITRHDMLCEVRSLLRIKGSK